MRLSDLERSGGKLELCPGVLTALARWHRLRIVAASPRSGPPVTLRGADERRREAAPPKPIPPPPKLPGCDPDPDLLPRTT